MNTTALQDRVKDWKYEPLDLKGQRALVTGGTTGIGRTTALMLAALGAEVAIFGRDEQHLRDAVADIKQTGGNVKPIQADVADQAQIQRIFDEVDQALGGLDILVNNAGLAASSVADMEPSEFRYVIETNLLGYMACAHEAAERMKKHGWGQIVNIGSLSAEGKGAGSDVYTATKSAIRGFSESLSKQLSEENIRVSLIEPGLVGTDLFPDEKQRDPKQQKKMQRKGEMMRTEEIAEAVRFCLVQPKRCSVLMMQIRQFASSE